MKKLEFYTLNSIKVDSLQLNEIEQRIREILTGNEFTQFVTFNLDFLRNTYSDIHFQNICKNSDYVSADGFGITSLLFLKYKKKFERITGNDLFILILEILNETCGSAAFIGSEEKVQNMLVKKIKQLYPNIKIVAAVSPVRNFENDRNENLNIIKLLKEKKPDVLFLALGSPRQEKWIFKYKNEIGAKINIGVGAVFDFYTGHKKRSPKFFQQAGLEWFWRFCSEPVRLFKRYFIYDLPLFIKLSFLALTGKKI